MSETKTYSIRDLSLEYDITPRTLRFYEDKGLLSPLRKGTQRIYDRRDKGRLALILRGKRLGFSLAESGDLIRLYQPTGDNRQQLGALLEKIEEKRTQLQQQLVDIQIMQQDLDAAEERARQALKELEESDV